MAILDKILSEKELALEFNSAKIIASPYDYRLTDRLILHGCATCAYNYNIFAKQNNTERYLCNVLKLDWTVPYMKPNPNLHLAGFSHNISDNEDYLDDLEKFLGATGTFIKYNNLILDEETFCDDLSKVGIMPAMLKTKPYLKALEVWLLKSTAKDSLIPNLMYLATEFKDYSLDDMENIRFAEKQMEDNKAPLMLNCRDYSSDTDIVPEMLYDANVIPLKYDKGDLASYTSIFNIDEDFYRMGRMYSLIYGAELLYHLNEITDDKLRGVLEELLSYQFDDKSFCAKYIYSFDSSGNLEINSGILACFCVDNELRFSSIKTYVESLLSLTDMQEGINASNIYYYGLPLFFGKMVGNMHGYAYQVARVKHATLLYKKAKESGLLKKEDFNSVVNSEDFSLFKNDIDEDDDSSAVSNELISLDTFSVDGESSLSDEDSIEKEKSVAKKDKDTPPMLSASDMLKKDLFDSPYSYDITYVRNDVSYKDAYNLIANNIKMITHELTRQIKEIKTYNTGGKQNGLLVGKLDKKNLWRYKMDPHIFYNNNYKLKEMDLAFGCILDESGSMYGDKIKNGRIVMIMLHEVLNSLGINHSIIGHTSSRMYQSKIFKYFQFKEESHYSLDKPYGLIKADNRSGNCDSGALYYMQSVMKQVRNKDKIVIIFSDGQPTECTETDLTKQINDMERNGIHVIGVGINFSSIKDYYPDNANGKNLKEMVDIVVSILKRYVLEKKE